MTERSNLLLRAFGADAFNYAVRYAEERGASPAVARMGSVSVGVAEVVAPVTFRLLRESHDHPQLFEEWRQNTNRAVIKATGVVATEGALWILAAAAAVNIAHATGNPALGVGAGVAARVALNGIVQEVMDRVI